MSTDWFRNTSWDEAIERAFDRRLRRARSSDRAQYLRIQACTLTSSHPEAALRLLDRYFQLPEVFDHAQAHVDCAEAFLALGRTEEAIAAYEAALEGEQARPNVLTQAYSYLPYLIATHKIRDRYPKD